MTEWSINPDCDDERAVFHKAVAELLKLDAEGCRIITMIADAMIEYSHWDPLEPRYDGPDRAEGGEQFDAFRELVQAMLGGPELAFRILPLAQARQAYQTELEADEAEDRRKNQAELETNEAECQRRAKPRRRERRAAKILHLVPKKDDPSGHEGDPD